MVVIWTMQEEGCSVLILTHSLSTGDLGDYPRMDYFKKCSTELNIWINSRPGKPLTVTVLQTPPRHHGLDRLETPALTLDLECTTP